MVDAMVSNRLRENYMAFYEKNNQYSPKGYCYYACVIGYALYAERGKAVMKKTNEVSKLVGVSRRTLQYYDNEGLLDVKRSKNNYRLYDENALERIWKIMLYKEMGFNLKEIHELLLLSENEQKDYLKGHMQKIEEEINALQDQIDFILMIIEQEMPNVSEDDSGTTYVQRIRELKNKVKYGGQKYDRKYYIEGIRKLRYRLDEAYQQLQQGHFRYAIYDTYAVMRKTMEILTQYVERTGRRENSLEKNIQICEKKQLLGNNMEILDGLQEVRCICENSEEDFEIEQTIDYDKTYFCIMQIKDLLNITERVVVNR